MSKGHACRQYINLVLGLFGGVFLSLLGITSALADAQNRDVEAEAISEKIQERHLIFDLIANPTFSEPIGGEIISYN